MTPDSLPPLAGATQYRRGAIMGLTVAEAFMLVAFILLMLLLFWRYAADEAPPPEPEEPDVPDSIINLPRDTLRVLDSLLVRVPDPADTFRVLDRLLVRVPDPVAAEIIENVALLPESGLEALRSGGTPVGPEALERLDATQRLSEAELETLRGGGTPVGPEALERLDALGERSAGEIVDAFELRDDLDPYREHSTAEIVDRIRELMSMQSWVNDAVAKEAEAAAELMRDLRTGLGSQIVQAGGRLEPGGRIVFPEKFLFAQGASGILPEFARILDRLCPTWLETLEDSSAARKVETVLIEGHSSSEWTGAPSAREAWVRNLELSQRRAQSVLVHCLNTVRDRPLGDWSRMKLAATGFSSSRPIRNPAGEEDAEASRRVVFGVAFSREQFFDTIRAGPASTREGLGELRGRADVKDADTIGIDGYNIRLDGIDALEKNQTCVRDNGTAWDCGEDARRAVEKHLDGKEVVCDRLSLGLGRFRGLCRVDGEDLNRWVVRQGWAFAYRRFSNDYIDDEGAARRARKGAWAGTPPTPPWEWRRNRRESGP